VFPVEAQRTALAPLSTALETAIVIPRSLKEPWIETFELKIDFDVDAEESGKVADGIKGVSPSSNVMTGFYR